MSQIDPKITELERIKKLNLHQRILGIYDEVTTVVKNKSVGDGNYTYMAVTHDNVTSLLHGPIAKYRIVVKPTQEACVISTFEKIKTWNGQDTKTIWYRADVTAAITFVNADDPKDEYTLRATAYAMDNSDKAVGKAFSMAAKMIYLKGFLLESADKEEDRDEDLERADVAPTKELPQREVKVDLNAKITINQQKALFEIAADSGVKATLVQAKVKELYNLDKSADLTVGQFSELCEAFKEHKKSVKK